MTTLEATGSPCIRCGTFAPQAPFWGRMLCADCVSREPALFSEAPSTASVLDAVRVLFGRVGLKILLINAVASLPGALLELRGGATGLPGMRFLEFMLEVAVGGVCTHLALQAAVQDKPTSFTAACGAVGRTFAQLLGSAFIGGMIALFFMLFLIVPGVLRLLSYTLSAPIVLLEGPIGSYDALKRSAERMAGHRWAAFGPYLILVGATVFVPLILFLVGLFVLVGDEIDQGTPLENLLTACFMLVMSTLVGLRHLIPVALYLKLAPPSVWPVRAG